MSGARPTAPTGSALADGDADAAGATMLRTAAGATDRPRVLYVVQPSPDPQRLTPFSFIDEEIEGLAAAGVEPHLLSFDAASKQARSGVRIIPVPTADWRDRFRTLPFLARWRSLLPNGCWQEPRRCVHDVRIERQLAEAIRRYDIDLIHTHFGASFGFGGMLARAATDRPLVVSFRGMDILRDASINYGLRLDPFYDRAVRALIRQMDFSTYASDFMRSAAIEMGAPARTAVTIHKGVDLEHFRVRPDQHQLREKLRVDAPMILTVVGLIERKGVDVILRALAGLRDTHDFQFVVCGKGPEREALERLSDDLGLAARTRFVGQISREQIAEYFAACDVFVLASHVEAAGNVLLEAMASGRPVVCTDSGGPPEYVRDGVTGYVVPPGEPDAMADKIGLLLDDPQLRDRLGQRGRKIVESEHRYGGLVEGYLDVYQRALSAHAGCRN